VDLLRPIRAFDRRQQEHRWLAFPVAVIKKFGDDQAGGLAALVAYYAFFSLFPLLLVFVTILGLVFHGNPSVQDSIENSVLAHFPIIGPDIKGKELHGTTAAIVIGILASLWAGLGVTQAARNAFDRVWAIPFKERADFLRSRARGLLLVVTLGVLFVVSSAVSGAMTSGLGGPALKAAGVVTSLALNLALFAAAFRILTSRTVPTSYLWIGVVIASVFWEILQLVGGYYIDHVVRRANSTYGTFALVIGLLVWLHLGAQVTLYAAEVNVVLARRLWPRSLFDPSGPADEETLRRLAKIEERSPRETVDVHFQSSQGVEQDDVQSGAPKAPAGPP
jgi:membrane protein